MDSFASTIRAKRLLLLLIPAFVNILCASALAQDQLTPSRPLLLRWLFETDGMADLTPAADERAVYAALNDGVIVSLGAADGGLLWKSEIGGRISASPFADARRVYVASESFQSRPRVWIGVTEGESLTTRSAREPRS